MAGDTRPSEPKKGETVGGDGRQSMVRKLKVRPEH